MDGPIEERRAFHGIPFSIKECYFVKNCDSTAGKFQIFWEGHKVLKKSSISMKLPMSLAAHWIGCARAGRRSGNKIEIQSQNAHKLLF